MLRTEPLSKPCTSMQELAVLGSWERIARTGTRVTDSETVMVDLSHPQDDQRAWGSERAQRRRLRPTSRCSCHLQSLTRIVLVDSHLPTYLSSSIERLASEWCSLNAM